MEESIQIRTVAAEISAPDLKYPADALPVLRPKLPPAEKVFPYLKRIDGTRLYSNRGPLVRELESRLGKTFRIPPASIRCAASGTQALVGGILAAAGRATARRPKAVVPAFTYVATALAVEACGYEALIADIDATTLMLDPDELLERSDLDEIGVVVPVAPFGNPVPQACWLEFSRKTGIPVVIDDAAGFDRLEASPEPFLGKIPVAVSFHATKAFGCGEGGCVICLDEEMTKKIGQSLNFGFRESRNCEVPSINGKMSEYHAAVGLAELDGWRDKLREFREVAAVYRRHFAEVGLGERFRATPEVSAAYALFACEDPAESETLQRALAEAKIGFRLWYGLGLGNHTHWATPLPEPLPMTERIAPCHVGLPWSMDLEETTIARIVGIVRSAVSPRP